MRRFRIGDQHPTSLVAPVPKGWRKDAGPVILRILKPVENCKVTLLPARFSFRTIFSEGRANAALFYARTGQIIPGDPEQPSPAFLNFNETSLRSIAGDPARVADDQRRVVLDKR